MRGGHAAVPPNPGVPSLGAVTPPPQKNDSLCPERGKVGRAQGGSSMRSGAPPREESGTENSPKTGPGGKVEPHKWP